MIWIVNTLLGGGTVFLLLFGEYFTARIQARRTRRESTVNGGIES